MIELKNINKYFFRNQKNEVHVINDTTLSLPDKGLVTILGESGSGKTTLLNVIGGLDNFDSGTLTIDGVKITNSNIDKIRNLNIGYIFQDYKLIDELNVYNNVAISLKLCGMTNKNEIKERVNYVLEILGIYRYRNRLVTNLSGGERQRVGIARAIVKNPKIVICDEPTGNLGSKNSVEIMNIIKSISKERLVILVTHETNLAEFYSDRIIKIVDGKIVSDEENSAKDELDYDLDNKIYLKDFDNREELSLGDNEINVFFDNKTKQKINIVIKDNNIYIESTSKNIEIIDNNRLQLIDDHKKKIDKSIYEKYEFKLDDFNKKNKSILSLGKMIIDNFKTINHIKGIKTLIVISSFLASMLIFYSVAKIGKNDYFEEKDYIQSGRNDVELVFNFTDAELQNEVGYRKRKEEIYNQLKARDDVIRIYVGTNSTSSSIISDRFYQTYGADTLQLNFVVQSIKSIKENDIILGRMPENDNEVVIDKMVYDQMCNDDSYCERSQVYDLGIMDVKDMLDIEVYSYINRQPFKIVGIVDNVSPCMYFTDGGLNNTVDEDALSQMMEEKLKEVVLVEGRLPEKDFEIILYKNSANIHKIGDKVDRDGIAGGKEDIFTVVGFYDHPEMRLSLYSKHTLFLERLATVDQLIIETKDKEKLMKEVSGKNFTLIDKVDREKEQFLVYQRIALRSSITTAIIALAIVIIEVFFVLRTSLLSRVKGIGIYRSIGVSKFDIYKMFLGEVLTLVSVGALVGSGIMFVLFMKMRKYPIISNQFMINPSTLIYTLLIILLVTFLVTILPIYFIVRKYPAQILTRRDI